MLDNDELTYSYQKRPAPARDNRQAERALITVDRSQKLDLLIHLLTNLQQSLIVCGPEGIGKTTLLKTFENSHKDIWPICFIQGSSALSFESAVSQLSRFLNLSSASVSFDLTALRAFCNKQKVVLIIDDAGALMPGLIGELMDFADSLSSLRLVFAMDNDVLQTKTDSESVLNECHFIEVPPLNQRQCLEYLQNLSAMPGSPISFGAVTDSLVEAMYRKTLGVPGKILAEFPKLKSLQGQQSIKWGLWLGVAGVVVATGLAIRAFLPVELLEQASVAKIAEPVKTSNEPATISPPSESAEPAEQIVPAENTAAPVTDLLTEPELPQAVVASQPETIELPKAPKEALNPLMPAEPEREQVVPKLQTEQKQPLVNSAKPVEALNKQPAKPVVKTNLPAPAEAPVAVNQPIVIPPQPPTLAKVEPVTAPVAALAPVVAPVVSKPMPELPPITTTPPAVPQLPAKTVETNPVENKPADIKPLEAKPVEKPAPVAPVKPANAKPDTAVTSDASDHEWIMAQPGENYTVQVMVLSSKDSVTRFMRKYAEFRSELKSYPIGKAGQEKYAIIYGSFATPVEALNQKSDMPPEFTNGLVKRMKQVQRENR